MSGISRRMNIPQDRVEQFIRESPWEYEVVQQHLVEEVPEPISNPKAVFVVDEVGLLKKGRHSVGVARQYSGAAGKVDNCQVAVNLTLGVPGKKRNADQITWPLGTQLYLPESWADDEDLRWEVGVPEEVEFQTKPAIGLDMIKRALDAGVQHTCTVADTVYGDSGPFRKQLREWNEPFVLSITPSRPRVVPSSTVIPSSKKTGKGRPPKYGTYPKDVKAQSPLQLARSVKRWRTVEWSQGTKGVLSGKFRRHRVQWVKESKKHSVTEEEGWLLLENRDGQFKAYMCWGLEDAALEDLVKYAKMRWTIERFHQDAKQELALDDFEGRTWKGWHHHVTMVLLGYAFLAKLRAEVGGKGKLPVLADVIRALVHEAGTQLLMNKHKFKRKRASVIAADLIREMTEWGL